MPVRKILLALGVVCVLGGVALLVVWLGQARKAAPESVQTRVETRVSVMTAATAIPRGASLKNDDLKSKELGPNEHLQPGSIVSGQEGEFLGALSQRDIAEGEPLIASDFTKANFLAVELKPGYQAITIPVDAAQSLSGLALQHDYVDVILIQSFGDKINIRYRTVGETVVRGVRVMALDQSLTRPTGVMAAVLGANVEAAIPRTVTLEVTEEQAEKLLVASKLGSFQLSLLPLKVAVANNNPIKLRDWFSPLSLKIAAADKLEDQRNGKPVWAKDVSPAINEIGKRRALSGRRAFARAALFAMSSGDRQHARQIGSVRPFKFGLLPRAGERDARGRPSPTAGAVARRTRSACASATGGRE